MAAQQSEWQSGKLVFEGTGSSRKRCITFTTKKGKPFKALVNLKLLAPDLRNDIADEVEVEFQTDPSGRPVRIVRSGQAITGDAGMAAPSELGAIKIADYLRTDEEVNQAVRREYHNPYNFIPALKRKQTGTELDDRPAQGHDRYQDLYWSGNIKIKLTTETPLLIPDAANARPNREVEDHNRYLTRRGADGKPYLPPTSIKGMLRAAYEAVTNSRMGVLEAHDERHAFRMPAKEGVKMVPIRIVEEGQRKYAVPLTGASQMRDDGSPRDGQPMYAAWIRQYGSQQNHTNGLNVEHKQEVWAYIKLWEHLPFRFWNVIAIRDGKLPLPTDTPQENRPNWNNAYPVNPAKEKWVKGYVCKTNQNIDKKHDERVFFNEDENRPAYGRMEVTFDHEKAWGELIRNYAEIHKDEIQKQKLNRPPALRNYCVWSRHITKELRNSGSESNLTNGDLCYARVQMVRGQPQVQGLYPVMIARDLHKKSPMELLDATLKPSSEKNSNNLSPADRVFGWVNQNGQGAYRGNIRISPATCSEDALASFGEEGLPLAILGQPKPQQARFYVAACDHGKAQRDGIPATEAAYTSEKGLRGRKVYPHHAGLPKDYWGQKPWKNDTRDLTQEQQEGFFREYRRPAEAVKDHQQRCRVNTQQNATAYLTKGGDGVRDNQNRSVLDWVKPHTVFTFDLNVTNLSRFELGALLWLLSLPDHCFHRLGGGKPLGFGSVRLEIDEMDLRTGAEWITYYKTLDAIDSTPEMNENALNCIEDFRQTVGTHYGNGVFYDAPFIRAFLKCAEGFNKPIHYPRACPPNWDPDAPVAPHPEGKAFEWFVANERVHKYQDQAGPKLALPDLANDEGLPILDAR